MHGSEYACKSAQEPLFIRKNGLFSVNSYASGQNAASAGVCTGKRKEGRGGGQLRASVYAPQIVIVLRTCYGNDAPPIPLIL